MRRFEAEGHVVRPTYLWLLGPIALTIAAVALLLQGNLMGMIPQAISMIMLAAGAQRRPRKRAATRIVVDDDALFAGSAPLVALADVVGLSATGAADARRLVIATRSGALVELELPSDAKVSELRAAIGLLLAQPASESFEAHGALGCVSVAVAFAASLYLVVLVAMRGDYRHPVAMGLLLPVIMAGVPLLLARVRSVTIRCGSEGISIERHLAPSLFGRRMIPWSQLAEAKPGHQGTIALITRDRRRLDYELGSAENVRRLMENIAERQGLPTVDGDENLGAILARGRQPTEAWLEGLRRQATPAQSSYRTQTLAEDRLWSVVEDPAADPTARVGAAVALRAQLRVADIEKRIRVAASSTALPEVRDALVELAEEPDDTRAVAKVARIIR